VGLFPKKSNQMIGIIVKKYSKFLKNVARQRVTITLEQNRRWKYRTKQFVCQRKTDHNM
jgi:hypothetical protein